MPESFQYDVFLSHSSKDKDIVRPLAERLRKDGLRVWFDAWVLKPGDNIPSKIEDGLEHSRVLVLFMSKQAFTSDWATLESQTFRFRDPLNKERRFVPLRLDSAPIKGSLAQFLYINWLQPNREEEYAKLLDTCRQPAATLVDKPAAGNQFPEKVIRLYYPAPKPSVWSREFVWTYAFSPDGKRALVGSGDKTVQLWDLETKLRLMMFKGHTEDVFSVAWSGDQRYALSGSADKTIRLWEAETGRCLRVLEGHKDGIHEVSWSTDQRFALSCSIDGTVRAWDVETGRCLRVLEGHTDAIYSLAWSSDQRHVLSGGADMTLRIWDVETGRCLRVLEGHTDAIYSLAWSSDQRYAISGGADKTVRLWEVEKGRSLTIFEGHTDCVQSVFWCPDQQNILSGGLDRTVRLWEAETGLCKVAFVGHSGDVRDIACSSDESRAFSGDITGNIRVWNLSEVIGRSLSPKVIVGELSPIPDQVQYTNAKVLLVGESGSGKTGLAKRLALNDWQPTDSTVGAWATHWKLPVSPSNGVERDIWLWDFGGQADQRLIHQLYMEDTALAVLVFDGQKEDLFETLGQWDRDLTRASRKPYTKVLVAGRVDASVLRVSRSQLETFAKERGFACFLETSAKANLGCEELKDSIIAGIRWTEIPWRSSPRLFKRLKEEIVRLKDEGRVLMRFNELRDALRLRLSGEDAHFKDTELKAVVGLLTGPGVVWELTFGNWVLLQPERINAYAQAVIQTMREDKYERGCLPEEQVLKSDLIYRSSIDRLEPEEERFILLAMHQTLVERGLCLREHTDKGPLLIFPSYYRRERPELGGHPAILVSYRFNGFLDDVYATLVVRLHHTKPFQQDELWRYAADFKTLTGRQLGVKLTRHVEGAGELDVYFDPAIPMEEKIIFSRYVHEHLLQSAIDVVRLRHYVCPHCGTPVGNRDVAMKKLAEGRKDIPCVNCDDASKRIPLWDEMEELFASEEMKAQVKLLQDQSKITLDNESKDRALVGEIISTVALAGQLSRELTVSNNGIDMEIEFRSDAGEPTGRKLYLLLRSGDSYMLKRRRGKSDLLRITNETHAHYWMAMPFPVMLVIRTVQGEVRWMEMRYTLQKASYYGRLQVKEIDFEGTRFDVMSVRRWRDFVLAKPLAAKS